MTKINIFGVIESSGDLLKEIQEVTSDTIVVSVNSPGGSAFDGIAIMNALVDHPARVEMHIDGIAASAASIVALAGDEIVIKSGAQLMIHDAWGLTVGNAATHRDAAATLESVSDNLASLYAERTGKPTWVWRDLMRAETWFNADEAVDIGLADRKRPLRGARAQADPEVQWADALKGYRFCGCSKAPEPLSGWSDRADRLERLMSKVNAHAAQR